jgi:hypothetical protein
MVIGILVTCGLSSHVAAQGDWVTVKTLAQDHVLYAQPVQRQAAAQTIPVTSLIDYSQVQYWGRNGDRFQSSTAQWELDCATRSYRSIAFVAFTERMGRGASVARQAQVTEWATAPAASVPGELLRWACP